MKKTVLLLCALLSGAAFAAPAKDVAAQDMLKRQTAGEKMLILDVRSPEEFTAGHVPGAINIPHDRITGSEAELKDWKQKPVVIYCRTGRRAGLAAEVLDKQGFTKLEHLSGDMEGWQKEGRPVVK